MKGSLLWHTDSHRQMKHSRYMRGQQQEQREREDHHRLEKGNRVEGDTRVPGAHRRVSGKITGSGVKAYECVTTHDVQMQG